MGKQSFVGIAQMKLTRDGEELLVAPNLGSCLGVSVYDPKQKLGGMIHCLLPLSSSDPEKAKQNPCMYVDTGVAYLLEQMIANGSELKALIIAVAGGSNINDANNVFEIGKKNITVLRKLLWRNNLLVKGEHVGENFSRTVTLDMATGKTTVKYQGKVIDLA
jgi:chemotaxis protein CheD